MPTKFKIVIEGYSEDDPNHKRAFGPFDTRGQARRFMKKKSWLSPRQTGESKLGWFAKTDRCTAVTAHIKTTRAKSKPMSRRDDLPEHDSRIYLE